jgi:predicted Rossmann fold flavoprotein
LGVRLPLGAPYITREVAQLGSALGLGPRCRRFESCLLDHSNLTPENQEFFLKIFMEVMMKIMVIGAGASGLTAAINLARKNYDVTILEKNNIVGKKILLTGNGRCNLWNLDQDFKHYHSHTPEILDKIINEENEIKVLPFFKSLNILLKNKNGYLYPNSNQATTIQESLLLECKLLGVKIKVNTIVKDIIYDNGFVIKTNGEDFFADKVILAMGSCTYPQTGSDGSGYTLAKKLGHTIIKPLPALVQLECVGNYFQDWAGVRSDATVSLFENDKFVSSESGEIQLTNYGISGICVMQLSTMISIGLAENKREKVVINFLPNFKTEMELENYLIQNNNFKKNIEELLNGLLNKKLTKIILKKSNIKNAKKLIEIDKQEMNILINNIINFEVEIKKTKGFDNAQVASGGIPLTEINLDNLESKIIKNLYFTGEIIDCNGDCGGYNLGFAWMTGLIVGDKID